MLDKEKIKRKIIAAKLSYRAKNRIKVLGLSSLLLLNYSSNSMPDKPQSNDNTDKISLVTDDNSYADINNPDRMYTVDYQVDTLAHAKHSLAYYLSWTNTITAHYFSQNTPEKNQYNTSPVIIQHEQQHRINYNAGLYAYVITREQAYKLNMHDEISATLAEALYRRDQYLKTGDMDVLTTNAKGLKRYREAIMAGEIIPNSPYYEDFEKEMFYLANGVRDYWMKYYASSPTYLRISLNKAIRYGETDGTHAAYYDKNYEKAQKIAYTLGGVDFTKYFKHDITIPRAGKIKLTLAALTDVMQNNLKSEQISATISQPQDSQDNIKDLAQKKQPTPPVPNKRIQKININREKRYQKWSTQKHVSELQYVEILNLTKPVIRKPSKTYSELRQTATQHLDDIRQQYYQSSQQPDSTAQRITLDENTLERVSKTRLEHPQDNTSVSVTSAMLYRYNLIR